MLMMHYEQSLKVIFKVSTSMVLTKTFLKYTAQTTYIQGVFTVKKNTKFGKNFHLEVT